MGQQILGEERGEMILGRERGETSFGVKGGLRRGKGGKKS